MESKNKKENLKEENEDDSNIDDDELQDEILEMNDNLEGVDQNNFEEFIGDNNDNDFFEEDEEQIKKNFEGEIIDTINMQNELNILDLNLDNIKKGIVNNHKQEFFDIFFDSSFYTNRNLEVEKLVQYIKKDSNHGLTGLKNLKNSGFLNSILQCLSHTLDFTYYILSKTYSGEINKNSRSKGTIINSIYSIISTLWTTNEKSIAPTDFKYNLLNYLPAYNNTNFQYDATEFLFEIFGLLNEELTLPQKKLHRSNGCEIDELASKMEGESDVQASKRFWNFHKQTNNSIISDLFNGQYKSTITCLVCENTSIYFEPFSAITLDIPELKRIDFVIVPQLNIRPVVKLTSFIPVNALFQDISKFTTEKFRKENSGFVSNEKKTKLKCMLVNTSTYTARFVKVNDNIYQMSRKGNIVIFEIDEGEDDVDYYPYICMVKEKFEEKVKEDINQENIEKENLDELKKDLNYNFKKKNAEEKQKNKDKDSSFDDHLKNLSFPRLFNISLNKNVRDLRISIYGFMRRYYKFDFNYLKSKNADTINTEFLPLNQINSNEIYSDPDVIRNLSDSDFETLVEEEYRYIFEDNYKEISLTEYLINFPYCVKLVSAKDDLKYKLLFSSNPSDFTQQIENEMTLLKLNQYIKIGYKLVLEIDPINSQFIFIKSELNKVFSIHPKESCEMPKTISLEDCFDNFILSEKLEKGNEWYCGLCKKNQNSLKKIELYYIPKNLIIILKRFETKMIGKTKIQIWKNNDIIKYPVNNFRIGRFFLSNSYYKENNISYDLYAVSQHSGSLEGGHYATACRNFGKWFEMDDATVFPSDEETVVSREGYILFYRRKEQK